MRSLIIRKIIPADDTPLAKIIRSSLEEFKANKPGTVYFDPTTDHLTDLFKTAGSAYFVAEAEGVVAGGCGIYPTQNLPPDTCELVKLYLAPAYRGKGLGRQLMETCIEAAKQAGYKNVYIETMPELTVAVPLYEKMGFAYLPSPSGNSGHDGCSIWMLKKL
jgi:putative acetyltransferase